MPDPKAPNERPAEAERASEAEGGDSLAVSGEGDVDSVEQAKPPSSSPSEHARVEGTVRFETEVEAAAQPEVEARGATGEASGEGSGDASGTGSGGPAEAYAPRAPDASASPESSEPSPSPPARPRLVWVGFERDALAGVTEAILDAEGEAQADLAVFPFFTDERPLGGLLGVFDWRGAGRFTRLVDDEGERAGEVGHAVLTLGSDALPARRIVLLGLGSTSAFDEQAAELAASRIGGVIRDLRPRSVMFGVSPVQSSREALDVFWRASIEAAEDTPVTWILCVEPRALARLRRRLEAADAG